MSRTYAEITYRRTGGIAGLVQTLVIEEMARLTVSDRRLGTLAERALTADEARQLEECLAAVAAASDAPRAAPPKVAISDAFQIELYLGEARDPHFTARAPMLPISGLDDGWDPLMAWLERTLNRALEATPGGGYEILPVE